MSQLFVLTPYEGEDAVEVKCSACGSGVKVMPSIKNEIDAATDPVVLCGICAEATAKEATATDKETDEAIKMALGE